MPLAGRAGALSLSLFVILKRNAARPARPARNIDNSIVYRTAPNRQAIASVRRAKPPRRLAFAREPTRTRTQCAAFLKKAPARPGVELPAARFQSRKDPRRGLGFAPLPFSSLPASPGAFGVTTAARANARHEQWRGREEGAAARRAHRLIVYARSTSANPPRRVCHASPRCDEPRAALARGGGAYSPCPRHFLAREGFG